MGIRGLQNFMEQIPHGQRIVSIKEEIRCQKKKHPDKKCVVIFDLLGLRSLWPYKNHEKDLLCGFRPNLVAHYIEIMFKEFICAGAELVFFADGNVQPGKIDLWLHRQDEKFIKSQNIFNLLGQGKTLEEMTKYVDVNKEEFASMINSASVGKNLLKKYGQLFEPVSNDCDLELANYARDNNAFAVLSNDSDFLIYSGNWRVWNMQKLNYYQLTVVEYDKCALKSYLKLEQHQMPIYATLMGNDCLQFEICKVFHQYLGSYNQRFLKVANYINRNDIRTRSRNFQNEIMRIARIIDDVDPEAVYHMILKGISSYDYKMYKKEDQDKLNIMASLGTFGYNLYAFETYTKAYRLYNYQKHFNFPLYYDVIVPIVCRSFGFILTLFRSDRMKVIKKISVKKSHNTKFQFESYEAEYPPVELKYPKYPSFESFSDGITKYKIMCWIFGIDYYKHIKLMDFPETIIPYVICLLYFTDRGLIDNDVADACLLTAYMVTSDRIPKNIHYPEYVDEKLLTFSILYDLIFYYVNRVARVLNLSFTNEPYRFDSVYFLWSHQHYSGNLEGKREKLIEYIKPYRLYAPRNLETDSSDSSLNEQIIELRYMSKRQE